MRNNIFLDDRARITPYVEPLQTLVDAITAKHLLFFNRYPIYAFVRMVLENLFMDNPPLKYKDYLEWQTAEPDYDVHRKFSQSLYNETDACTAQLRRNAVRDIQNDEDWMALFDVAFSPLMQTVIPYAVVQHIAEKVKEMA